MDPLSVVNMIRKECVCDLKLAHITVRRHWAFNEDAPSDEYMLWLVVSNTFLSQCPIDGHWDGTVVSQSQAEKLVEGGMKIYRIEGRFSQPAL